MIDLSDLSLHDRKELEALSWVLMAASPRHRLYHQMRARYLKLLKKGKQ